MLRFKELKLLLKESGGQTAGKKRKINLVVDSAAVLDGDDIDEASEQAVEANHESCAPSEEVARRDEVCISECC